VDRRRPRRLAWRRPRRQFSTGRRDGAQPAGGTPAVLTLILLLLAPAALAQDLFPRFSLAGSVAPASFETNARIDPNGTPINFERDLGLDDSRNLRRFGLQCARSAGTSWR
jgi:hypothetical protein